MKTSAQLSKANSSLDVQASITDILYRLYNIESFLSNLRVDFDELIKESKEDHAELIKIISIREFFMKFALPGFITFFTLGLFFSRILAHFHVTGS